MRLKKIIVDDDLTFVTNNSADFRGPSDDPERSGLHYSVIFSTHVEDLALVIFAVVPNHEIYSRFHARSP
jgi:hypothetical protein